MHKGACFGRVWQRSPKESPTVSLKKELNQSCPLLKQIQADNARLLAEVEALKKKAVTPEPVVVAAESGDAQKEA